MSLFISMDGRINRMQFWIGLIVLVVAGIILGLLLLTPIFGSWSGFITSLIFFYPAIALFAKRLRDRGRTNIVLWLVAYFAPGFVTNIAQAAEIGFQTVDLGGLQASVPNTLGGILTFLAFVAFVVAVFDLGFFKGAQSE